MNTENIRLTGVIVPMSGESLENERLLKRFMPSIEIADGEIENWDAFESECMAREEKLDSQTKKYLCGQDDGIIFYFTDDTEALEFIKNIFPEFDLTTIHSGDLPWDYDYRRDLN